MLKLEDNFIKEHDENVKYINGTLDKKFIRIDSVYLNDLIQSLLDPKCSYRTCLDDSIKENYRDGKLPLQYIPVLLKKEREQLIYLKGKIINISDHTSVIREEICSQIANTLGVSTVYNVTACSNEKDNDAYYTMSVDFRRDGEEIVELDDGYIDLGEYSSFDKWYTYIVSQIYARYYDYYYECDETKYSNMERKIIKDFAKLFLTRKYIFSDLDFRARNISFIHNKKDQTFDLSPMYDFELCFDGFYNAQNPIKFLDEDLLKIGQICPEVIGEMLHSVENFYDGDELKEDLIENIVSKSSVDVKYSEAISNKLKNALKIFRESLQRNQYLDDDLEQ